MTDISAKVIADSVNEHNNRIITLQLRYPRFIHAEFMTHRVFSRNASSSRAIPVKKEIEHVHNNPALPIHIGRNAKGMQAHEEITPEEAEEVRGRLHQLGKHVADEIKSLNETYKVHKQDLNRYLEPWLHIDVVVTATSWDNFFYLRDSKQAQPEIKQLAKQMRIVIDRSEPVLRKLSCHMPYWTENLVSLDVHTQILACVARCARVSYRNHDGGFDTEKDIKLAKILYDNGHWSPFEHVATPSFDRHANLLGWKSVRYLIDNGLFSC